MRRKASSARISRLSFCFLWLWRRLHETRSELVVNLKPLWKVVRFPWRFHYGNNSSIAHVHKLSTLMILRNFISLRTFTVYMENLLSECEICAEVSFTTLKVMWTLIMKLPYTEVKFYPKWNLKPVWVDFGSHVNVLYDVKLNVKKEFLKIATLQNKCDNVVFRDSHPKQF